MSPLDDLLGARDDASSDEGDRAEIERLVEEIREQSQRGMEHLHPIERLMVLDVLERNGHLNCKGCIVWLTKLLDRMKSG